MKHFLEVEGWLSKIEGDTLSALAALIMEPQVIVELGSYEGRSSLALSQFTHRPVYCVDLWELGGQWETTVARRPGEALHQDDPKHWEAFKANTIDVPNIVSVHGRTQDVGRKWKGGQKVGLLFIDAGHSYDDVIGDLDAWMPHVVASGTVCVHDYVNEDYPEIRRAVDDYFQHVEVDTHIIDSMLVITADR